MNHISHRRIMYPHVMTNKERIHGMFYVHDSAFSLPGDLFPCMHVCIYAEKESTTPIISIRHGHRNGTFLWHTDYRAWSDTWAECDIIQTSFTDYLRYKRWYLLFTTDVTIGPPQRTSILVQRRGDSQSWEYTRYRFHARSHSSHHLPDREDMSHAKVGSCFIRVRIK